MKTTVKRVLWQRTLETAGPLRRPLPTAAHRVGVDLGAGDDLTGVSRGTIHAGKVTVHELATAYAKALIADTVKNAAAAFHAMHLGKPFLVSAGGAAGTGAWPWPVIGAGGDVKLLEGGFVVSSWS